MTVENASNSALKLLMKLIAIPSYSKYENVTADLLEKYLVMQGCDVKRSGNNVWATTGVEDTKPTLLLNSHHDTVKPVDGWISDPHKPILDDYRLIGLGSNDAGASLVCLLQTFLIKKDQKLPWNLIFLASAEEEISGANGVESVLKELPVIDFGIVGEPTGMKAAIAEKGLIVLDGYSHGKSGHAARDEGDNALYKAIQDIEILRNIKFPKVSDLLGPVKLSVTQIESGTQHNVVPDSSHFVIDVRTTELYSNQEVLEIIQKSVSSEIIPRSLRLNSSGIPSDHAIFEHLSRLNVKTYGSPTLSDQALMTFPTLKMGPGESERSHTAGEYILLQELEQGITDYLSLLKNLKI